MNKRPEILAPAGDMTMLQAVLDAGCDAVYLGLERLNMRRMATRNFTLETLPEASQRCRGRNVRCYLTLNSILFEDELSECRELLEFVKPYVDAVIAADWAVINICRQLGIAFHISTQMSCSNSAAADFLKAQGAQRIVLARECTLEEVKRISRNADIPVEVFVHGAVCVAMSGRCLLSHDAYGYSANRGECRQPCRRKFVIREMREDEDADAEFKVEPHTVLSARDLCSLPFVDRLMEAGVAAFKIEGRARNPEYGAAVVAAYRQAVEAVMKGDFTEALMSELVKKCAAVYHRPFGTGLYHGRPGSDQLADTDENQATQRKRHAGLVLNYYNEARAVHIQIQDHTIAVGDTITIHGPKTGVVKMVVSELRQDEKELAQVKKGNWVTLPCNERVRRGDKVFLVEERKSEEVDR